MRYRRKPLLYIFIFLLSGSGVAAAQTLVEVTPANPQGWMVANARADSSVTISATQPRAGSGSLEFVTSFVTSGQDKVDYELRWDPRLQPGRTLGNLSHLSYEYYRDSQATTVAGHFHPVVRLGWLHDPGTPLDPTDDSYGAFVYEEIYQGVNPVPVDQWVSRTIDLANDNIWVYCGNCGGSSGVVQNFSTSFQGWQSGPVTGQPGDPQPPDMSQGTTYIFSVNTGVGSGWNNDLLMWVDQIRLAFSPSDDHLYNFEMDAAVSSPVAVPGIGIPAMLLLVFLLSLITARLEPSLRARFR